jgi:hypothetical protein
MPRHQPAYTLNGLRLPAGASHPKDGLVLRDIVPAEFNFSKDCRWDPPGWLLIRSSEKIANLWRDDTSVFGQVTANCNGIIQDQHPKWIFARNLNTSRWRSVYSNQQSPDGAVTAKRNFAVGVECDTTMRERSSTRRGHPTCSDDQQRHLQVSRSFNPGTIDLDDLAEAVRQLLDADFAVATGTARRPDLLSQPRRATQVMGANEQEAPAT